MGDSVFSGVRAVWLPLYGQLRGMARDVLDDFEERETSHGLLWKHHTTFAEISAKKSGLVVGLASDVTRDEWEPVKMVQTSKNRVTHYFEVTDDSLFPALMERIAQSYALTRATPPRARPAAESAPPCTTVDEYIVSFPDEVRAILTRVRETIRAAVPEATEKISWQMPTYHLRENLIHFAGFQRHIGVFPGPEAVEAFADRLQTEGYKFSKGTIQFPLARPIPYGLIGEIARFRRDAVLGGGSH